MHLLAAGNLEECSHQRESVIAGPLPMMRRNKERSFMRIMMSNFCSEVAERSQGLCIMHFLLSLQLEGFYAGFNDAT
jgi:hypothetical protein